ncbi:MAG: EAL domain-containing protein [Gallionella sp.]|nr:EAL domain-containing protein [Gallionella sp.]MCK9352880.1 EAL domain-containing protein [Gallionella sp.]
MENPDICRVLLVEDDPGDANLVRQMLRLGGEGRFDATWVVTLADTRQRLSEGMFDVVLLDLSLPDSSGLATVQACRQLNARLPIIVLTGHDDKVFALQTIEAGAQDYLVKGSFEEDALIRAMRYAISRASLEHSLAETGTQLRTLINAMPDIVCFKDGEGRWLEANDFNLKLFQLDGVDYRGKKDSELAAYQDFYRESFLGGEASDEEAWRAGQMVRGEETIPRPDGTALVFDIIKVPLFHPDDSRKGLVMVGRDITARKQAEERLNLASRVFDTTGEGIAVTDMHANIVAINPAFTKITGYSEAEILGQNPRILKSGRQDKGFYLDFWRELTTRGEWRGELWNMRKNGEIYPQWSTVSAIRNEAGENISYVAVFSDMTEIQQAQQRADQLAWRDPLTGLANRPLFLRQVEQTLAGAKREKHFSDVLLLDLDRFKEINEARGLAVGDALLKAVAHRFSMLLHEDDLLARLDSDEFAVLLPRLRTTREAAGHEALAVAEKLRTALREAFEVDGESIHIDVSIGIVLLPESQEATAVDALRQADMALARAKAEGGGRTVFFEARMGEAVKERFQLEAELRGAIIGGQLRLYLQPQVNAAGHQVGAEALVRWQHPLRGLVMPGAFIPMAEASGLIVEIDQWMLSEVCRLLARLDSEGMTLRIAVNISPRHFQQPNFVADVRRHLSASGADATHLVLEVTEGLMIGDIADVIAKMTALSALGIHFSIDDFGTGYSSLAYIKRLPIHELKIDKSFIQDVVTDQNDAALVETIVAVARHLHLQVVAEGVETQAQAELLNAYGNIIHQGYLYGRPEPEEKWLQGLERGRPSQT